MPEYIQEFFLSDAVRSQEKGELQLTVVADFRQRIGAAAGALIQYGLTDRLQISAEAVYGITASQDQFEILPQWNPINVGLLYQFIRCDRPFALSAGMTIGVPVRSSDKLSYEPTILLAKAFGKLQIHTSFLSDVEGWNPSFEYNLASVYPVKQRWFPTFEFNARRQNARNAFYLTPGIYRHFRHHLEVGIGIPLGIGGFAGPLGVVAKTNWELGASDGQNSTDQAAHGNR